MEKKTASLELELLMPLIAMLEPANRASLTTSLLAGCLLFGDFEKLKEKLRTHDVDKTCQCGGQNDHAEKVVDFILAHENELVGDDARRVADKFKGVRLGGFAHAS